MQALLSTKSLILLLAVVVAAVSLFGALTSFSMDEHGNMSDCPFMAGHTALCPMSLFDHLGSWQSYFTSIIPLILIIGVLAGAYMAHQIAAEKQDADSAGRFYLRHSFEHKPLQPLAVALSRGILQPKLYA